MNPNKALLYFVVLIMISVGGCVALDRLATGQLNDAGYDECDFIGSSTGPTACECDCSDLDMRFVKYNSGGLGASSCWCYNGNESVRIW